MFDWIWKGGAAMWVAWNYWSIVLVGVVIAVGFVIWKVAMTPKEYQERLAWEQNRENQKLSQTYVRRLGTTALIWMFALMASIVFVVAMYKMMFS